MDERRKNRGPTAEAKPALRRRGRCGYCALSSVAWAVAGLGCALLAAALPWLGCDNGSDDKTDEAVCGNRSREAGEPCDGTDFPAGQDTCEALGFSGGTLACDATCPVDVSECTP